MNRPELIQDWQHREATLRVCLHQVEKENARLKAENARLRLVAQAATIGHAPDSHPQPRAAA